MQNFNKFNDSDYISDAPDKLNDNFQTIASDFAGTSFPITDLVEGMICHRTDEGKVYRYRGNSWRLEYTIVDGGIKVKQATNDANDKAITSYVAKVEVGSAQGTIKVTDGAGNSTEFTSYAIATETQAEEGNDNTTVMTPLGVKNGIDKQRPLKTYTSFEQLGFTSTPTLEQILKAMPAYSKLVLFIRSSAVSAIGVPDAGVLEITKGEFIDYATLILNRYGGDDILRKTWVENWAKGQTSFNWQEVITYEDNGNTARTNLNLRLQTFTNLSQLGLTTAATPEQIAKALPENSEISFYATGAMKPTLGQPVNGSCRIEKRSTAGYSTVNFFLYAQISVANYYGVYSSYNNKGFSGWKKLATNGALSMPSSDNTISLDSTLTEYTAPSDGWLFVTALSNGGGSTHGWVRLANKTSINMGSMQEALTGFTMRVYLPLAKGDTGAIAILNSSVTDIRFVYAQSEV